MNESAPIQPGELGQLEGNESIPGSGSTVLDFWRWALGDLRMNNARGYLVEFLVAKAVGDGSRVRVEWGDWDVEAADGTRIEVKAAGRLQSWTTKQLSPPAWGFKSVRADRAWAEDVGSYVPVDPATRVHVWVFALQTATEPSDYDPLDLDQWEFRVIPHRRLLATGQVSARLSFFERHHIASVTYPDLREAIVSARRTNDRLAG